MRSSLRKQTDCRNTSEKHQLARGEDVDQQTQALCKIFPRKTFTKIMHINFELNKFKVPALSME